jgi:YD repeat-containing protein
VNQYDVFNGPAGQKTMQYDFAGNPINEIASTTQQQYTYDFLNRLSVCVDYANNTTRYRYDALRRPKPATPLPAELSGSGTAQSRDRTNQIRPSPVNPFVNHEGPSA